MPEIGIGIVGGGYMGKAHAVAMSAVGAVFDTALRPRLEMICASSAGLAERYRAAYGFARATADWRVAGRRPERRGHRHRRRRRARTAPSPRPPSRLASRSSARSRWAPRWTTAAPWSRPPRQRASPTWSASTTSARPASQFARRLIADGRDRRRSPGSAASTPRTSWPIRDAPATWRTPGDGQRHDGRSGAAHDQRGAGPDRADRRADRRGRDRPPDAARPGGRRPSPTTTTPR